MDRRTRNLFALALVGIVALTGGAAILLSGDGAESELSARGVIVGIDSEGLDRVRAFRLRTDDAQTIQFEMGTLENGAAFPPGHLAEHQATAQPVLVWYVRTGDANVAFRIDDAP